MEAIHFAEFVMAKEKRDRIGSSEAVVYPMKFFFFHGKKEIMMILGSPFRHPELDDKDVLALTARLFAITLDAVAVLHVTEGWVADRCGSCGSSKATLDRRCGACGSEIVQPSQNPYRQEMLIATLSIRNHEKAFFWTSRFDRDGESRITSFTDQLQCVPMEAAGRFMQVWALETWMGPHFAVNLPTVLHALGREVSDKVVNIARVAEKMAPPGFQFVRLNMEDVMSVLKRMTLEEN